MNVKEFFGGIILLIIIIGLIMRAKFTKIPSWSIMSLAASITILFGLVPIYNVSNIIDWNVILFLISMFSIISIAETSGLLDYLAAYLVSSFKSRILLLYLLALFFGLLSSIMVNDAVAIVGTSLSVIIAKSLELPFEPLIILVAFSITIGSVMTPLGNPQNMLIATETNINAPLLTFLKYLAIPTIINLFLTTYFIIKYYKIKELKKEFFMGVPQEYIKNKRDAYISLIAIIIIIISLLVNDFLELYKLPHVTSIGLIPFTIAAFIYIFVSDPRQTLSKVNWGTIIFFITMFIATQGIWNSGILYEPLHLLLPHYMRGVNNILRISASSLIFSQLISNVPFTNLFIVYMNNLGYTYANVISWITLAMATTIAGNLTILGAASNIIIIDNLESKYGITITYKDFMKIGIPITLINLIVYIVYIILIF
ncbi:Na+/H+ antiporter NhaD-like permease [Caldisphaera lagunensis DSM 15908]|uniref:Na+/H+ antiporter NhaD-like permease n=2 Tax=Caldisphaera lagunensis TaxID=200415 RepID=L0A9R3_CALLD|nr:Na+/H+ antiporter NhaD-like permease [Caldisphaera lagunensis DSM 15908]